MQRVKIKDGGKGIWVKEAKTGNEGKMFSYTQLIN